MMLSVLRQRIEDELINAQAEGVSREACRVVIHIIAEKYDLVAAFTPTLIGSVSDSASAERKETT